LETKHTSTLITGLRLFKGAADNPFLAPRGVCLVAGKLLVADTAQNRVFIWNELPAAEHQEADIVLGQPKKMNTGRNAGGGVNGSTLFYPSGIWSDGTRLVVADAWNHRVLIWHTFPTQDGQPADVVLGQPDFAANQPNVDGIASPPSARSMNWPYGVYSEGQRLWVADTGNRRVLYYPEIPQVSYTPASGVIGKRDFEERDYDHEDAIWPYSAKVGPNGELAITDTQYYRVLLWKDWEKAFSTPADVIIGQESFEANGQNQFGWFPKANTLNWCYDSHFYKNGLWVGDTGNSRLLWFDQVPTSHNTPANDLLGQDNFETGSENMKAILTTENSYYWPFSISIENQIMVVADTGNHRVVINHLSI
jgi:hypothetical protein